MEGVLAVVIDLDSRRKIPTSFMSLSHPAGVTLPFDGPRDAALILPEIRSRIVSGAYCADLLTQVDLAVKPGDRVLVIGAGLGTVSTAIAKRRGVKRVIAVEANPEIYPYLKRTHELNGVPWVETVNVVLDKGRKAPVPFFARHDIRTSSLLEDYCSWQLATVVPCMDINLIIAEEQISLIVCEVPTGAAELLASANLDPVERILVSGGDDALSLREEHDVLSVLLDSGFEAEKSGTTMMFGRAEIAGQTYLSANSRA